MCQMARRQLHQPVAATRICLFNSWLINATTFWLESEALNRKPLDSPVPPVLPALAWATRASERYIDERKRAVVSWLDRLGGEFDLHQPGQKPPFGQQLLSTIFSCLSSPKASGASAVLSRTRNSDRIPADTYQSDRECT